MPLPVNYCNMLTLLAHILGQKQVWIGDDGKLWLAVVYGCPQVTSQSKGYVETAGLGPWITTDPSNEQQTRQVHTATCVTRLQTS